MSTDPLSKRDIFDSPFTYEIRVQGRLAAEWSDRLEGMAIVVSVPEGALPETLLIGSLTDQAALAGVLDRLYALRLPVISVRRLEI